MVSCVKNKYLYSYVKTKGFTLIELLVVISMIGVLASTILVGMRAARGKAKNIQIKSDIRSLTTALESYAAENSEVYPKSTGEQLDAGSPYNFIPKAYAAINQTYTCGGLVPDTNVVSGPVACVLLSGYLSKIPHNSDGSFYQYESINGTYYILQGKSAEDATKWITVKKEASKDGFDMVTNGDPLFTYTAPPLPTWAAGSSVAASKNLNGKYTLNWSPAMIVVNNSWKYRYGIKSGSGTEVLSGYLDALSATGVSLNTALDNVIKVYAYNANYYKSESDNNQPVYTLLAIYASDNTIPTCYFSLSSYTPNTLNFVGSVNDLGGSGIKGAVMTYTDQDINKTDTQVFTLTDYNIMTNVAATGGHTYIATGKVTDGAGNVGTCSTSGNKLVMSLAPTFTSQPTVDASGNLKYQATSTLGPISKYVLRYEYPLGTNRYVFDVGTSTSILLNSGGSACNGSNLGSYPSINIFVDAYDKDNNKASSNSIATNKCISTPPVFTTQPTVNSAGTLSYMATNAVRYELRFKSSGYNVGSTYQMNESTSRPLEPTESTCYGLNPYPAIDIIVDAYNSSNNKTSSNSVTTSRCFIPPMD